MSTASPPPARIPPAYEQAGFDSGFHPLCGKSDAMFFGLTTFAEAPLDEAAELRLEKASYSEIHTMSSQATLEGALYANDITLGLREDEVYEPGTDTLLVPGGVRKREHREPRLGGARRDRGDHPLLTATPASSAAGARGRGDFLYIYDPNIPDHRVISLADDTTEAFDLPCDNLAASLRFFFHQLGRHLDPERVSGHESVDQGGVYLDPNAHDWGPVAPIPLEARRAWAAWVYSLLAVECL